MKNITHIVEMGVCVGCGACAGCKHIHFEPSDLGFDMPHVDPECIGCGKCLSQCSFDPFAEDD